MVKKNTTPPQRVENLEIRGSIYVSHGVIREMVLSKGWLINNDSVGTVWHHIHKMCYEFVQDIEGKLYERLQKLKEDNKTRMWKKNYVSFQKSYNWCDEVTIGLSAHVYDHSGEISLSSVEVKIKGTHKKYRTNLREALDKYVKTELEKQLK
jgi:hypothetical protein